MKRTKFLFSIGLATVLFSSCGLFNKGKLTYQKNTEEQNTARIQKSSPMNHVSSQYDLSMLNDLNSDINTSASLEINQDLATTSDDISLAKDDVNKTKEIRNEIRFTHSNAHVQGASKTVNKKVKGLTFSQKKFTYKQLKNNLKDDLDRVVIVVLCFFIPPLAVYLFEGKWTDRCTINLILTLLCGLPGVIHALLVVLK